MADYYPPVGFSFEVDFEVYPWAIEDIQFQEVSGLQVELETESFVEGGENRFTHQLPTRTRFSDLTLKRGLVKSSSAIFQWVRNSLERYDFQPANLTISLLDPDGFPLHSWDVVNAIPKRWEISNFNAEQNSVVIETFQLSYQYFTNSRSDS